MTTAGEAASLFGPADPASDPFAAAIGGDDAQDRLNNHFSVPDAAADLFGSATDTFPVEEQGMGATQPEVQQTRYDPAGQQTYAYNTTTASSYAPSYPEHPSYAQANGYTQYPHYDQATASTAAACEPSYTQQHTYAPQSYSSYDSPYVPASTVQHAPGTQSGTFTTSAYDPYKPTQTKSSHEPLFRPSTTLDPSPYDPYKPSHAAAPATYQPNVQLGTLAAGPQAVVNPPVTIPAPPTPLVDVPPPVPPAATVAPYRPKKLNAYDPPLPPIKAPKHVPVPPRQTYDTPPPMSPPRSTSVTQPLQPPPPPQGPPRSSSAYGSRGTEPQRLGRPETSHYQSGPYQPSYSNGATQPAQYAPTYQTVHSGSDYEPSDQHIRPGPPSRPQGSSTQFNGGHPLSRDAEPEPERYPMAEKYPMAPEHEVVESIFGPQKAWSPAEHHLDPDDSTPQAASYGFVQDSKASPPPPSSPPRALRSPVSTSSNRSDEASHPSPVRYVPSSPERSKSPPKASSFTSGSPPPEPAPSHANDAYRPPARTDPTSRAKSPSGSSVRSVQSTAAQAYEPSRKAPGTASSPPLSRPLSSQSRRSTLSNAYEPQSVSNPNRAASPAGSVRSITVANSSVYDPYAPPEKKANVDGAHTRSMSNGSAYSSASAGDPYAPSKYIARQSGEHAYSSFALPVQSSSYATPPASYDRLGGQVVTLAAPVQSTYAPSPSLLGTNDPLGRTAARVPVVSFGFGGKLVTCFHGASMNTGFDVALSARQSTDIKILSLNKVIPDSALDTSTASYPGPLFSDPGSPTTSLVRTGATQLRAKKARVIKYLEERAEEIKGGLGYHRPGSVDRSRAEAKRILVLLLKIMVEHDGRLSGSIEIDAAVRSALLPELDGATSQTDGIKTASTIVPASSSDLLSSAQYPLRSAVPHAQDCTVSTTVVRSSHLDKIQSLLARGDRRGACHYAADEKLWPHALVIASSIDKETWKDVVTEWVRAELAQTDRQSQGDATEGRESLRVAYSLFGGNGAAAVQELIAPSKLLHQPQTLQIPQPQLAITPMTPNFPVVQPLNIPQEVLANWPRTAAMILCNPTTLDSSAAITALGDQLSAHQWVEAAHACYLLSPQTSPLGGMGSHPRLTLLGSPSPAVSPIYYKDPDPIIFSEIAEFAMSLATPVKGQEAFVGLPHLQPYRLLRAVCLAEIGHVQLANRYCEAITACLSRGSPYANVTLLEQLKGLSDRLTAAPQLDKSGSWIPGKMAKPSLDSIGNWLERGITKFIAGEGDSPRPEESKGMAAQQSYSGPFANYSSISSATSSALPSPHHSVTDLTDVANAAPPFRTGSAMGARPPSRSQFPINRASSAMDYARSPYGNGYGYAPPQGSDYLKPESGSHANLHSKSSNASSWWGASESDAATTPTATNFGSSEDQHSSSTSNSGFISLMDDPMLSMTPTATKQQGSPLPRPSQHGIEEEEEDDLGLGNNSLRPKKTEKTENGDATEHTAPKEEEKAKPAEPPKPEVKQTASSGWLSRLWRRGESTPAPVKANLGEESSFYYDKELKRWVNKNATSDAAKPAAPPPPPRAQTASPGRSFGAMPPSSPVGPPPARPATAHPIDLTGEPPRNRQPPRVRSNLVPTDAEGTSAPPSPMPPSGTPPPPGGGPPMGAGKQRPAAKRNVRSRYVDVFQQEANTTGSS